MTSWAKARQTWELEIGGRSWRARPVSAHRVMLYQAQLLGAGEAQGWALVLELLRDAFPWRPSYMWRGDPVKHFARLIRDTPEAASEALRDFFPLLAGVPTTPAPATHGTNSPR